MATFKWFSRIDEVPLDVTVLQEMGLDSDRLVAAGNLLQKESSIMLCKLVGEFTKIWIEGIEEGDATKVFAAMVSINTVTTLAVDSEVADSMFPGLSIVTNSAIRYAMSARLHDDEASAAAMAQRIMELVKEPVDAFVGRSVALKDKIMQTLGFTDVGDMLRKYHEVMKAREERGEA